MTDSESAPGFTLDPIPTAKLRWRCDESAFTFETTADVEPISGVIGQDTAVDALTFGLEVDAPGQNIFVRGLTGTGRSTLLRRLLETMKPECPSAPDRCYVHNFHKPDRPNLITVPRGEGEPLRTGMDEFIEFIRTDLGEALTSDVVKARVSVIEGRAKGEITKVTEPFDEELRAAGLTLVLAQFGPTTRQLIVPLIDGEPATPERMEALRAEGKVSDEDLKAMRTKIEEFSQRLEEVGERAQSIQAKSQEERRTLIQDEARTILHSAAKELLGNVLKSEVVAFIGDVVEDVVTRGLAHLGESEAFTERYRVNLIEYHEPGETCPTIVENAPSVQALLGTIDRSISPDEVAQAPHMLIHAGSLLRADGGYLILEARDLLSEPGAWKALIRTLRSGKVEMVAPDGPVTWRVPPIKPEPIPVNVKVILIGDAQLYYILDAMDADFPFLFKVLADFEDVIPRDDKGLQYYAGVLARVANDEKMPPLHRSAVAALCEHGVRIAAHNGKLTLKFGRLADLAREAAFLARKAGAKVVTGDDVRHAVRRTKRRANLPSRRFHENIASGTLRIQCTGTAVGQVNGLAVIQAGPLTYGFPTRITTSIGPGNEGTINVEGESALSGRIHTKGFHILGGLLRRLLRTDHPLTFAASIAFEQSYGGIDGDSASGAEVCSLISALTGVPARQDLAMTGAIDQHGHILPIGGVNEKIEGFYDACQSCHPTDTQGVIIPKTNVGDLMLRPDVVEACERGTFAVYAVDRIHEALGLFMNTAPGELDEDDTYPDGTLLGMAVDSARHFWEMATPSINLEMLEQGEEEQAEEPEA